MASVDDLPEGTMMGTIMKCGGVLVARVGDRYHAVASECTHAACELPDGELDVEEGTVTCECHGSVFDLVTGDVVEPPADEPLLVFRVRVTGDELQVAADG